MGSQLSCGAVRCGVMRVRVRVSLWAVAMASSCRTNWWWRCRWAVGRRQEAMQDGRRSLSGAKMGGPEVSKGTMDVERW